MFTRSITRPMTLIMSLVLCSQRTGLPRNSLKSSPFIFHFCVTLFKVHQNSWHYVLLLFCLIIIFPYDPETYHLHFYHEIHTILPFRRDFSTVKLVVYLQLFLDQHDSLRVRSVFLVVSGTPPFLELYEQSFVWPTDLSPPSPFLSHLVYSGICGTIVNVKWG